MRVPIVETAMVTAFGAGIDPLWQALTAGRSALAPIRRFPTDAYVTDRGACLAELDAVAPEERFEALLDRLLEGLTVPRDCHLLVATTKAGIDQVDQAEQGGHGPQDRVRGQQVAAALAERLGLRGPSRAVSAACASASVALTLGAARIAAGRADAVLICAADLVSAFTVSGFSALRALSPAGCRPFDAHRDGLNLGDGAAAILLLSEARRRREGRLCRGRLRGWGLGGDAAHITAPSRTGKGLVQAVQQALSGAAIGPEDIGGICAHGTGSVYNDAMEMTAFQRVFARPVPTVSIKGATGHTLAAAGAIETILGLRALAAGSLPPTVGLCEPDPAARHWVRPAVQPLSRGLLLNTNSGFGGINAALVLEGGAE